jgi:hypothetical protein
MSIKEATKEVTVNIPEDVLSELKWLSEIMGVSATIALRHAIATDGYIQNELKKNSTFFVQKKKTGLYHEVSWIDPQDAAKALENQ